MYSKIHIKCIIHKEYSTLVSMLLLKKEKVRANLGSLTLVLNNLLLLFLRKKYLTK